MSYSLKCTILFLSSIFKFPAFFLRFMRETFVVTWMHWKPLTIEDISVNITALVTSNWSFSICIHSRIHNRNIHVYMDALEVIDNWGHICNNNCTTLTLIWYFSICIHSQIYKFIKGTLTNVSWSFIYLQESIEALSVKITALVTSLQEDFKKITGNEVNSKI